MAIPTKRLILCCDGTWMDSYDGYNKPTLIPYVPTGTLQVPSNVTRISRYLTKIGLDDKPQIIYYHSGVGTGFSVVDTIAGGLLGKGISENIREAYSFIAANYVPGDEIILIGFSRGAFTVRSVAGMIKAIGLLTRSGMAEFYPIFKDQENFRNDNYHDIFPTLPFANKPRGKGAAEIYKRRLLDAGLTRAIDPDGTVIGVRAVAVWDTVGSLGIPNIPILSRFKLQKSANEYMFYDTNLSGTIKHAFQALALDEHRAPFSPAVWERSNMERTTIDLRQVWFPGAHSNAGGGYDDQGIANISLAWMMDQLASIGVAFQDEAIDLIAAESAEFYQRPVKAPMFSGLFSRNADVQWATTDIYDKYKPYRPWGLGKIYESVKGMYGITGKICRTPGRYTRADPETGMPTDIPLTHTNERIHGCVRTRLDLEGLDVDDKGLYKCHALLDNALWRLRQVTMAVNDPIPSSATWGGVPPSEPGRDDRRWIWEYVGPEETAPPDRVMVEENLGPYQRKLFRLTTDIQQRHPKRRRRRSRRRDSPQDDQNEKLAYDSNEKSEFRRRHSQYNDPPPSRYEQNASGRRRSYNGPPPQYDTQTEHRRGDGVVVDDHVARQRRKESRTRSRPESRYTRDSDTSNGERPVRREKGDDRYGDDQIP